MEALHWRRSSAQPDVLKSGVQNRAGRFSPGFVPGETWKGPLLDTTARIAQYQSRKPKLQRSKTQKSTSVKLSTPATAYLVPLCAAVCQPSQTSLVKRTEESLMVSGRRRDRTLWYSSSFCENHFYLQFKVRKNKQTLLEILCRKSQERERYCSAWVGSCQTVIYLVGRNTVRWL